MLHEGEKVPLDLEKAAYWLEKAAEIGFRSHSFSSL
jgi:TPR repeat protein